MANDLNHRALAVSQSVYGWLLRAYPPAHRADYGPAMAQLFRDQARDAWHEAQGWGVVKLWLRTLPDLVNTALTERLSALNPRKSMSNKMTAVFRPLTSPIAAFISVFFIVFLLVSMLSVAVTFILPESYASTCRIKVEQDENTARPGLVQSSYDPYFIQTTFEIMQSQLVLGPVIDKLNLNGVWGKKYYQGTPLKTSESLAILKARLNLAPVRNTKLVSITVYSDDRNEAAEIANAVAASYRDYREETRANFAALGLAALEQQYKLQEGHIHAAQAEVETLRRQFNLANAAAEKGSPQEQPYWDKQRDLTQLRDLHKQLFAKIEAEKIAAQIPKSSPAQITDTAEPGNWPVKPNKTLNILIGAVAGGFLGLVAGGASALIAFKLGQRGRKKIAVIQA